MSETASSPVALLYLNPSYPHDWYVMSSSVMKTIIIDYESMRRGGIEEYLSNFMRYCVETGNQVIWLTTENSVKHSAYKEITDCNLIHKGWITKTPFGPMYPNINISNDGVVLISTDPLRYIMSHRMSCLHGKKVQHILVLGNFFGSLYYPEDAFRSKSLRNHWHLFMNGVAERLASGDAVRAGASKQLEAYRLRYHLHLDCSCERVLAPILALPNQPKIQDLESRSEERGKRFEIITCARMSFPHKGYMLGLIRSFSALKNRYPQAVLTIVGDGAGKAEVISLIDSFDISVSSSIELTGELNQSEYHNRLRNAHLFVGLAGALTQAAGESLPSIVMRHSTYKCEGYGFIEDVKEGERLSGVAGIDVTPLIESVITMGNKEYIEHCHQARKTVEKSWKADPTYLLRQKTSVSLDAFGLKSELLGRLLYFERLISSRLLRRGNYPIFENHG